MLREREDVVWEGHDEGVGREVCFQKGLHELLQELQRWLEGGGCSIRRGGCCVGGGGRKMREGEEVVWEGYDGGGVGRGGLLSEGTPRTDARTGCAMMDGSGW